jgi:hypothetical protein
MKGRRNRDRKQGKEVKEGGERRNEERKAVKEGSEGRNEERKVSSFKGQKEDWWR